MPRLPSRSPEGTLSASLPPMKVLIVDDERDIRETLDMVLRYAGYETRLANGAAEALAEQRDVDDPLESLPAML